MKVIASRTVVTTRQPTELNPVRSADAVDDVAGNFARPDRAVSAGPVHDAAPGHAGEVVILDEYPGAPAGRRARIDHQAAHPVPDDPQSGTMICLNRRVARVRVR